MKDTLKKYWIRIVAVLSLMVAALLLYSSRDPDRSLLTNLSNISTVMTAAGLLFLVVQIGYTRVSFEDDHRRSRRQSAIELLLEWPKNLDEANSAAMHLVEKFDHEQCRKLYRFEPISVKSEFRKLARAALGDTTKPAAGGPSVPEFTLDESEVSRIRWKAISYLNVLECILSAWRHKVADPDIIKEQFSYLASQVHGFSAMSNLRAVLGGAESYPSITLFINEISKDNVEAKTQGQKKTG